jgi:phosphoribosyl-ATP pyrophosphohydrolase
MKNQINLMELLEIVQNRINSQDNNSYIKKLSDNGVEKIAQKVGEEAVEVVIASLLFEANKNLSNDLTSKLRSDLINEFCDLFFHSLILMAKSKINLEEIFCELYQRNQKLK